jgi:hypothetical protein
MRNLCGLTGLVLLSVVGCTPWYQAYGITDEAGLREAGAVEKLVNALRSQDCGHNAEAARTLASFAELPPDVGPLAARSLERCYANFYDGKIPWSDAESLFLLARRINPRELVGWIASILGHSWQPCRHEGVDKFRRFGFQEATLLETLAKMSKEDPDEDVRAAAGSAYRASQAFPVLPEAGGAGSSGRVDGALANEKVIVAVFDVADPSQRFPAETLVQLTDYLAARLTEFASFKVVPRDQLRRQLLDEKSGTYQACFEQSCQIELGKALAAQKSLATKLLRVGTKCAITGVLFDLRSETTDRSTTVRTECSDDALMDGMDQLSRQLGSP